MARKKKTEAPQEQTTFSEVTLDELNDSEEVVIEHVYSTDDKASSGK